MPKKTRTKLKVKPVVVETAAVAVEPVITEKQQQEARQAELLAHLDWLKTNNFNDTGQIEVALSQVNQRLTEL